MEQGSVRRRRWPGRLWRGVGRGLSALGGITLGLAGDEWAARDLPGRYPERVRPDLALTPLERALALEVFPQGWPR
ncbi:hypothetical protein OHV05_03485 [Kitasatospora sp. NBC_00070]|uniref:hypothetical protein n=1 Tax=Kitasatospora sp. NBC_00070 TaxID=2975962 RepID=UPI003248EFDF